MTKRETADMSGRIKAGEGTYQARENATAGKVETAVMNSQSKYVVGVAGLMALASAVQALPDFKITSAGLIGEKEPSRVYVGGTFRAEITVKNIGTTTGDAGYLDVWANRSSLPSPGNKGDKCAYVGSLGVGKTKKITFTGLSGGATYNGSRCFRAFIDSQGKTAEINESNNKVSLSYDPVAPDLVVDRVSFAPVRDARGWFICTVRVKNVGTAAWRRGTYRGKTGIKVRFTAPGTDVFKTVYLDDNIASLAPGAAWTFDPGPHATLGNQCNVTADVGSVVPEISESNNTTAAVVR